MSQLFRTTTRVCPIAGAAIAACVAVAAVPLSGCSTIHGMFTESPDEVLADNMAESSGELPQDPAPESAQESPRGGPISAQELRERNRAFADRYRVVLAGATDTIMDRRTDPEIRRKAHQLKVDGATAVYDIVVDDSPQSALLNLVVQITLQKKLANASAAADFPDDHPLIETKVEQLFDEAWSHAALVMDERERKAVMAIIDRWWQDHGGEKGIWYVRMSDLAGYGGGTPFEGLIDSARGLPSQLLNSFVPLSDASESLDEITAVSESAAWFAPRLVVLTQWRLEAIVFEALATTELTETIDAIAAMAETADTLPEEIGREVTTTIDALADREAALSPLLERTEAVVGAVGTTTNEATELAESIEQTAGALTELSESVKPLIGRFTSDGEPSLGDVSPDKAEGEPFDITEYTETARALEATLEDAAVVLDRVESAAGRLILYAAIGAIAVIASLCVGVVLTIRASRPSRPASHSRRSPREAGRTPPRALRATRPA
ncbi:MAG: hypothetical protein AAGF47_09665 [Planctomycetota bacterium]